MPGISIWIHLLLGMALKYQYHILLWDISSYGLSVIKEQKKNKNKTNKQTKTSSRDYNL